MAGSSPRTTPENRGPGLSRARFLRVAAGSVLGAGVLPLGGHWASEVYAAGAAEAAATVERLGRPYSSYLILDTALGSDAAGGPLLYASTYAVSDEGVYFVAVHPATGEVVTQVHLTDTWGNYHIAAAPDGNVYLGSHTATGPARLRRYDPGTGQVSDVAVTSDYIFYGVAVGPWSTGLGGIPSPALYKVYVGAYPSGKIYEYDPALGTLTDLGVVVPGNTYAKAVLALPDKRLVIGTGTPAHLTLYDVTTGAKTELLPEQYRGYSFAYNADLVGDGVFVKVVIPDSRLLRFDAASLTFLGESPSVPGNWGPPVFPTQRAGGPGDSVYVGGNIAGGSSGIWLDSLPKGTARLATADSSWAGTHVWWIDVGGEAWATSIGINGDWGRWKPKPSGRSGEVVKHRLPLPGAAKEITALWRGPDGRIYGDTYESLVLYAWDPQADSLDVFGRVAEDRSGEVLAMASTEGKLFIAFYTHAVLAVYDPAQPWNPGTDRNSNPRDLGSMGEDQYRPQDAVVGSDGRVWVATWAAYGQLGGALTAVDPVTYQMESWRHLAGDHNLHSLAPGTDEIYAGTSRYGDGVSASGDARLLVFDQVRGTKVHDAVPVPGAGIVLALAVAPDGRVFGSTDTGRWFSFDPRSRTVTDLGGFPLGAANGLLEGPDGYLYGHTAAAAFRIDPTDNAVIKLADGGSRFSRPLAFDGTGRFYWASGPDLMRLAP